MGAFDFLAAQPSSGYLPPTRANALSKANAAGSTGIGLTPSFPTPQTEQALNAPPAPPEIPMQQPAAAPLPAQGSSRGKGGQQQLIDFNERPFGALGLIFSSMAAGMRGQPSPVAQLQKQKLLEGGQQLGGLYAVDIHLCGRGGSLVVGPIPRDS